MNPRNGEAIKRADAHKLYNRALARFNKKKALAPKTRNGVAIET